MTEREAAELLVRSLLPRFWRLRMKELRESGRWEARAQGPLSTILNFAESSEKALGGLAQGLAMYRLPRLLTHGGWRVLAREVDQCEVFIAASPSGERWAVTVGDPVDEGLRRVLTGMVEYHRPRPRPVIIPPIATLTYRELIDALGD